MNENSSPIPPLERYRPRGRAGIQQIDVDRAADELLRQGERPSQEKVRERIGGSPNTLGPLLDDWWRRLGARVAAGPSAFERLPGSLALMAEAFFLHALDAARRLAAQEARQATEAVDAGTRSVEARSHVLTLREKDWNELLNRQREELERLREERNALLTANARLEASRDYYQRAVAKVPASPGKRPATRRKAKTSRKAPRRVTKGASRMRPARKKTLK